MNAYDEKNSSYKFDAVKTGGMAIRTGGVASRTHTVCHIHPQVLPLEIC